MGHQLRWPDLGAGQRKVEPYLTGSLSANYHSGRLGRAPGRIGDLVAQDYCVNGRLIKMFFASRDGSRQKTEEVPLWSK